MSLWTGVMIGAKLVSNSQWQITERQVYKDDPSAILAFLDNRILTVTDGATVKMYMQYKHNVHIPFSKFAYLNQLTNVISRKVMQNVGFEGGGHIQYSQTSQNLLMYITSKQENMVQWWYKLVGKKTVYTLSISSKLKNGGNVIKREINGEVDLCLT